MDKKNKTTEERALLQAAFDRIDVDKDGSLSKEEANSVLKDIGQENSQEEVDALFKAIDADGDGKISFEELWKWYTSEGKAKGSLKAFKTKLSGMMKTAQRSLKELVNTITDAEKKINHHDINLKVGDYESVNTSINVELAFGPHAKEKFAGISKGLDGISPFGVVFELPCENPEKLKPSLLAVFNWFAVTINSEAYYGEEEESEERPKLKFDAVVGDKVIKVYFKSILKDMQSALDEIAPFLDVIGPNNADVNIEFGTKASPKTINWEEFMLYEKRNFFSHLLFGSELDVELRLPEGLMKSLAAFLESEQGADLLDISREDVGPFLALLKLKSSKIDLTADDVLTYVDRQDEGGDSIMEVLKDFASDSLFRKTFVKGPKIFRDLVKGLLKNANSEFKVHLGWANICASLSFKTQDLSSWWQLLSALYNAENCGYRSDRKETNRERKEADLDFRKKMGELTEEEYDKLMEDLGDEDY